MKRAGTDSLIFRHGRAKAAALAALGVLGLMAVAGPSGLLAWSENRQLLRQREGEVRQLVAQRDELRNRVNLLNPRQADPDLVGELLRKDLNVVHPDEVVMIVN